MRVIGFDPFPALGNIHKLSPGVELARTLSELIKESDVLSIHVPLTDKTRDSIGHSIIDELPRGAILVNYARGPIVDEEAVIKALDSGRLSNYITDFPSGRLVAHPKVLAPSPSWRQHRRK